MPKIRKSLSELGEVLLPEAYCSAVQAQQRLRWKSAVYIVFCKVLLPEAFVLTAFILQKLTLWLKIFCLNGF